MAKTKSTIPGLEGLDLTGLSDDDIASIKGQQAFVYGPQLNTVRDLFNQAKDQYKLDIGAANRNADSSKRYATAAIPEVRQIFENAKTAAQASTDTVNQVMGAYNTGAAADPFRRALAREQQSASDRIVNEGAKAHQELKDRATSAEAGRQFAITQAKKDYRKAKDTLSTKLLDILQEQGATTSGLAADIRGAKGAAAADAAKEAAKDKKAADKEKAKADKEEAERIKGIHSATDAYVNKIADAQADWKLYTTKGIPLMVADPNNAGKQIQQTYTEDDIKRNGGRDPWGKPVKVGDLVYRKGTPSDLKDALGSIRDEEGHLKYTPGDIHIMLLRQVGKPLDAQAMAYIRRLRGKGVRIPRAWLQPRVGATPGVSDRPSVGGTPSDPYGSGPGHA